MNATHALNLAIKSLVPPGGRAVISGYEHNAVTRPLAALGAQVRVARGPLFDPPAVLEAFARQIGPDTHAVICSHVSNVFGFVQPIEEIAALVPPPGNSADCRCVAVSGCTAAGYDGSGGGISCHAGT